MFAANGVEDTVTLVPGWSRQIELPEPADLLVAEIIGNEPLEEEILETTLDARRRLLKPDARLIPHTLTLLARPLLLPDDEARQRAIGRAAVERWRELYGMEFQPLLDAAAPGPGQHAHRGGGGRDVAARRAAGRSSPRWTSRRSTDASVRASADLVVDAPGAVNAVAVTFRAALYGTIEHTLDPWTWPTSSWATSVWVLPRPARSRAGGSAARALPPAVAGTARRAHVRGRRAELRLSSAESGLRRCASSPGAVLLEPCDTLREERLTWEWCVVGRAAGQRWWSEARRMRPAGQGGGAAAGRPGLRGSAAGAAASRRAQRAGPDGTRSSAGRAARVRCPDRRGVRGRQGQGPRHLATAVLRKETRSWLNGRGRKLALALEAGVTGETGAMSELVHGRRERLVAEHDGQLARQSCQRSSQSRDDSLSDVSVAVQGVDAVGNKAFAEFVLTAKFSGPWVVDEDVVIEPNGREIVLAGVVAADFSGDKISAFRTVLRRSGADGAAAAAGVALEEQDSAGWRARTASSSRTRRLRPISRCSRSGSPQAAIAAAGLGDDEEFGVFVRDDDGRVVAGVSGIVWGGYCELQAMWVDESLRGRGLARALMTGAEDEARRRGCALVVFHAYDLLRRRPLRAARLRDRRRDRGLSGGQRGPLVPQGPVSPADFVVKRA